MRYTRKATFENLPKPVGSTPRLAPNNASLFSSLEPRVHDLSDLPEAKRNSEPGR